MNHNPKIEKVALSLNSNSMNMRFPLYVPSSESDIRTHLLEGQRSIVSSLPTQNPIFDKTSGYVYVPIKQSIIFMFASETPPAPFLPLDGCMHAQTERGRELLPELQLGYTDTIPNNCFFLETILWSDGFLAHQFSVKNDASAHVCFVTIGAQNGDQSGNHTFLV